MLVPFIGRVESPKDVLMNGNFIAPIDRERFSDKENSCHYEFTVIYCSRDFRLMRYCSSFHFVMNELPCQARRR